MNMIISPDRHQHKIKSSERQKLHNMCALEIFISVAIIMALLLKWIEEAPFLFHTHANMPALGLVAKKGMQFLLLVIRTKKESDKSPID